IRPAKSESPGGRPARTSGPASTIGPGQSPVEVGSGSRTPSGPTEPGPGVASAPTASGDRPILVSARTTRTVLDACAWAIASVNCCVVMIPPAGPLGPTVGAEDAGVEELGVGVAEAAS